MYIKNFLKFKRGQDLENPLLEIIEIFLLKTQNLFY